jgi:hypothetical protein
MNRIRSAAPAVVLLAVAIPACSGTATKSASSVPRDAGGAAPATGPGPLRDGYQRFWTPPVTVAPGDSAIWAQWVGPPLAEDTDVLDVTGWQPSGGNHALMYATTDIQPVGTSHAWAGSDQLPSRMVGGIGGETGANAKLPAGVVFRIKHGSALMVQTHYLNAGSTSMTVQTALDVKLAPVDTTKRVASLFASTSPNVNVAASGTTTMDVSCHVQSDLRFLMTSNHMHEWGVAVFTERLDPTSGIASDVKRDAYWNTEWEFNPNFTHYSVDNPFVIPTGTTLHTQCTWSNSTGASLTFPKEMCVFVGFILGDSDITCVDDQWLAAGPTSTQSDGGATD